MSDRKHVVAWEGKESEQIDGEKEKAAKRPFFVPLFFFFHSFDLGLVASLSLSLSVSLSLSLSSLSSLSFILPPFASAPAIRASSFP